MKTKVLGEKFLDYATYADYHERFNRYGLSESNKRLLPQLLKETTTDVSIQSKFEDILKTLLHYLSNAGIFYGHSPKACLYISYVLSEKVHSMTGQDYTEDTYQIFKTFVDKYIARKGLHNHRCKSELTKIEHDKYKQMQALYQVYNKYTPLSQTYAPRNLDYCESMTYLVSLYNAFLNTYQPGNLEFNTILKHFQGLMNEIALKAKPHCRGRTFPVVNPDLFEEPKVIAPPPPLEIESKTSQGDTLDNTGISEHSKVTRLATSGEGVEVGENPQIAKGPEESDPLRKHMNNEISLECKDLICHMITLIQTQQYQKEKMPLDQHF
ncbi:hypothetical protein PVIIG_06441 [Plasmodium vivax India VII]|uniref:Uncharacterized protein n=1 Tax=Plasmodium vivax India VII TaxID=1077284 RepID=A0A0J9UU25_PLAVI|nr:hypothetical protein PVIIG_06441 [Plasmodium vivax India VII]